MIGLMSSSAQDGVFGKIPGSRMGTKPAAFSMMPRYRPLFHVSLLNGFCM